MINRPVEINPYFLMIHLRLTKHFLEKVPNLTEIKAVIRKLNNSNVSGMDGLDAKKHEYGSDHMCAMLTDVIQRV